MLCLCFLNACGGGSSGSSAASSGEIDTNTNTWGKALIQQLDAGGLLIPNIETRHRDGRFAQAAFYTSSAETSGRYILNHLVFDLENLRADVPTPVVEIDNCRTIGFDLSASGEPVIAYQGGNIRECGSEQQSDVMMSIGQNGAWNESTAGIGYVARNPVFQDGLAGRTVATVVDSAGGVHLCYQFFYEGCDAMNFNYPDLLYVYKDSANPSAGGEEETVEGNRYNANGTASEQNRVGEYAAIVMDADNAPAIFYFADLSPNSQGSDSKGLRVARRQNGEWEREWVDTGITVGSISAGLDPSGRLVAAYYVESEYEDATGFTHGYCLKMAVAGSTGWETTVVDEQARCGQYCSLSFDRDGHPAVAYRVLESHSGNVQYMDLRYGIRTGTKWVTETVASAGDIGLYNTLWFDADNTAYISSYAADAHAIYLFYR